MKRLALIFMAVLLTGASDPWVDAASQDLHGYARALSLDLRGVVPSEAELEAIEAAGAIDESMLDEWLESPGFEEQVILEHREQFWNLLDINLLATRRLNIRSGTYFNNRRTRYTRLATQTFCGDFEATVDEFNSPVEGSVQINEDGSLSEGYVWVEPFWAPGTTVKVCAYDAQTHDVTDEGVDCSTSEGFEEQQCGCGPNLQWCFDNNRERLIETALVTDLNERVREMLQAGGDYSRLFDGENMFVNGASAHFFRHLVPFAEANYESPVAMEDLPDIPFTESAYIAAPLKDHHDGILTAPGWLLRHQTNRGRANRFYGAFLCAEFLPTETALEGDDPSVLPSPDLQRRSGCLDCHARLEPWAAYWGRWREAGARYHSDEDIPAFSEECSVCAVTGTSCPDICDDYYVTRPSHTDELPYLGWAAVYAFLQDDHSAHPDLGPLGWVDKTSETADFGACAVKNASGWLLNASASDAQAQEWTAQFQVDGNYRTLVKRIVMSGPYWGGE